QRDHLECARPAVPLVFDGRAHGCALSDGSDLRRWRTQHHTDELHGQPRLRAGCLFRPGRQRVVHRRRPLRGARGVEESRRRGITTLTEERCAGCRFDGSQYSHIDARKSLRTMATRWRWAAADIDEAVLACRPAPAVWSPTEYADHTADVVSSVSYLLH